MAIDVEKEESINTSSSCNIMNATTEDADVEERPYRTLYQIVSLAILCLCIFLYGYIVYKLYKKNMDDMEPTPIMQINFTITSGLRVALPAMTVIDQLSGCVIRPKSGICWYYFVMFFTYICFLIDTLLMQINFFLTVYWNAKYAGRVTPEISYICCFVSKIIGILITIIVSFMDWDYAECSYEYALIHLKPMNIYFIAYPQLVVAGILVAVAIYMLVTMIMLDKKIQPVVNLPTVAAASQTSTSFIVERKREDPFQFEKPQRGNRLQTTEGQSNVATFQRNDTSNSATMYRNQVTPPLQSCIPPIHHSVLFAKAKRAFIMNLITLVLLSIIIIPSILTIVHQSCHLYDNCAAYLGQYKISASIRMIGHFLHQGLMIKKMDKI